MMNNDSNISNQSSKQVINNVLSFILKPRAQKTFLEIFEVVAVIIRAIKGFKCD